MRIAIDLTALSYHMSGIERHALNMTQSLLKLDQNNEYVLIFRGKIYPELKNKVDDKRITAYIINGNNKLIFYQFILPFHLYKIKADKYMFFSFVSPVLFRKKGIYNTIPDTSAWDYSQAVSLLHKLYGQISAHAAIGASEKILTISYFSKGRINQLLHVPNEKIVVTPCGVAHKFLYIGPVSFKDVKEKYGLPDKYIMSLSTLEPRKNLPLLLETYSRIENEVDYDLVLVGRLGWKMNDQLDKYLNDTRIHFTGFVEDNEVITLYRNTICFVFPSAYEGFGLPPLEALSIGAPVLSSDAASLPEVLREQAVYFKSNSSDELKMKLLDIENLAESMPRELDEYQKHNYRFDESAEIILKLIDMANN